MSTAATQAENHKPVAIRRTLPAVAANVDLVQAALKSGNVEMYREAVALFKELEGMAARKAFDNAMADAKAEIPTIRKNREVDSGGRGPKYRFEDLAEIARTVDPILARHGLNYRFRTRQEGAQIIVTCVVSHRDGHCEENTLQAGPDNGPGRNVIQQIGSTQTYLQRYTLKASLGLAASQDDDGRSSEPETEPETPPPADSITLDQVDFLRDALAEKGAAVTAFLQFAGAKGWFAGRKQRLEELPAKHYAAAAHAIATFKKA